MQCPRTRPGNEQQILQMWRSSSPTAPAEVHWVLLLLLLLLLLRARILLLLLLLLPLLLLMMTLPPSVA